MNGNREGRKVWPCTCDLLGRRRQLLQVQSLPTLHSQSPSSGALAPGEVVFESCSCDCNTWSLLLNISTILASFERPSTLPQGVYSLSLMSHRQSNCSHVWVTEQNFRTQKDCVIIQCVWSTLPRGRYPIDTWPMKGTRWCSHRLENKWCYQEEDELQPEQNIGQTWTSQYPSPPPSHRLARKTLHSVKIIFTPTCYPQRIDWISCIKYELLLISYNSSHLDNFLDSLLVTFCEEGDCLGRPHRSLQKPLPVWVFS